MTFISDTWDSIGAACYQAYSHFNQFPEYCENKAGKLAVICEAIYCMPSTISSALKWQRDRTAKLITSHDLTTDKTNRTGQLFLHGALESTEKQSATVFLHGDLGHPFANYPLIEAAKQASSQPVFSLYLPYDDDHPETHRAMLEQGIQKMQELFIEKGNTLRYLTMVGHSKGAIESAHYAFHRLPKEESPPIEVVKVISIAGRLKVVPSKYGPCHPVLHPTVNEAYKGILKHPEIPLYQIIGEQDWNAPMEAMAVRPDQDCFIQKNEGHVTIVYSDETKRLIQKILTPS